MNKNRQHNSKAGYPLGGGERFKLPSDMSMHQELWGNSCVHVFRHRKLGELGRVVMLETTDGTCVSSCEVAGDPADPMTAERAAIFKPLGLEITERMSAVVGPAPANVFREPLPRPPETAEVIECKHMQCEGCDAMVAMLIFAPEATDIGHFEDYARKMYPQYTRLNLLTWIIGPALGNGPLMDRPADILKVWPAREPMQRLRPAQFNPIVDQLAERHCWPAGKPAGLPKTAAAEYGEMASIAAKFDARLLDMIDEGCDDVTIFTEMGDAMPEFKRVLDTAGQEALDELCGRFDGFYRYAQILEDIAIGVASGDIVVP